MAAKFKYCTTASDLVIKDLKAQPDTYFEGQVLLPGLTTSGAEVGVQNAGANVGASIVGICNQGETLPAAALLQAPGSPVGNNGATLTGTQAAGTIENLKVIINTDAVYALQYDDATRLTWSNIDDVSVDFGTGGTGFGTLAGGWAWSFNTGELDYIVESANGATELCVTVTGTNTTSTTGIIILPGGATSSAIPLTIDGLQIDANFSVNSTDLVDPGSDVAAVSGVILENRIESQTHGSEILDPVVHNQEVRFMRSNTDERDLAKAFAYVRFNTILSA